MSRRNLQRVAKSTRILAGAIVAGFLFVSDVAAAEVYRIGISLGLTGQYAVPAEMQRRGYLMWEEEVNERGGFLGRKVELHIENDKSSEDEVRRIYFALINDHRVDMTFGPYSSALTIAAVGIVAGHGHSMIVAGASADEIWDKGYKNIFGLYARASRYSKGMLELALERGLTEVAIIHADDSFSKIAAEGTKRWASAYGLNIVMIEEFVKGRRNLINLAQLAQRSSAELLVVAGHFDESVDMRSALDQINWYPPAYYATIGPALPEYHETLGLESEHTFSSSFWLPNSNISDAKAFEMNFKSRYDSAPSYQAAAAYAAGQVLEEAVKLSGSLERSRISDALSDLDVDTVFGRYGVDQTGMQTKHVEVILQWQGGDRVIVWPKNHRTAAAHFR